MSVNVRLTESPKRQALITLTSEGQELSCSIDAPVIDSVAWRRLQSEGFDESSVTSSYKEDIVAKEFRDRIATAVATLKNAAGLLDRNRAFVGDNVSFLQFAERVICEENSTRQSISKTEKYRVATSRFNQYLTDIGKKDLLIRNLNSDIIEDFDRKLEKDGLKPSTIAFYNRILGAIYLRGVRQGLSVDNRPFATVTTQYREKTTTADCPGKLTIKDVKKMYRATLSGNEDLKETRDILMLAYYSDLSIEEIAGLYRGEDGNIRIKDSGIDNRISLKGLDILSHYSHKGFIFFRSIRKNEIYFSPGLLRRIRNRLAKNQIRLKWLFKLPVTPTLTIMRRIYRQTK